MLVRNITLGLSVVLAAMALNDLSLGRAEDALRKPQPWERSIIKVIADKQGANGGLSFTQWPEQSTLAAKARNAIIIDPLDTSLMRRSIGLSLIPDPRGTARQRYLMERVSRRNLAVELELIEDRVSRGDTVGVLKRYDRVLRVHREAGQVVLPVLARAARLPEISSALVRYSDAPWFPDLVAAAIDEGVDAPTFTVLTNIAGPALNEEKRTTFVGRYLARLAELGRFDEAHDFALRESPTVPGILGSIAISSQSLDPRLGPFGWRIIDNEMVQARFDGKNGFDVQMAPENTQTIAQRITFLQPGEYTLSHELSVSGSGSDTASLSWKIACLRNSDKTKLIEVTPVSQDNAVFIAPLLIPQNCTVQHWRAILTGPRTQMGFSIHVGNLKMVSASQNRTDNHSH